MKLQRTVGKSVNLAPELCGAEFHARELLSKRNLLGAAKDHYERHCNLILTAGTPHPFGRHSTPAR